VLLLAVWPGLAQESEPADASVTAIRREVERLRAELADFDAQQSGVLASLDRLSMERLILEEEIRALEAERGGLERRVAATRARTSELEVRVEEETIYLAAALRQAYKMGRLRYYRTLLEVEDPELFARAYRYINVWSRADGDRLDAFRDAVAQLAAERQALGGRIAEVGRNREESQARRGGLERNRATQQATLSRIQEERDAGEEAFKELEEAAGRLEVLVTSFAGESPIPVDGNLVDLTTLKGHLPWPAEGKVAVPFGSIRHPRFGTLTPHPGIDIAVAPGTAVRPIFGGRVVYAEWFRGYGQTVIVDHGGGTTSIYAHLKYPRVELGDRVDPEDSLGPSGSTGSLRGPLLYLEIRHRGETVDPLEWLRPAPGS